MYITISYFMNSTEFFFQPYSKKMKNTTDEDKKNMYLRIIVSHAFYCWCNGVTLQTYKFNFFIYAENSLHIMSYSVFW